MVNFSRAFAFAPSDRRRCRRSRTPHGRSITMMDDKRSPSLIVSTEPSPSLGMRGHAQPASNGGADVSNETEPSRPSFPLKNGGDASNAGAPSRPPLSDAQRPPPQTRPALQAVPSQHGSPAAPQLTTAHVPPLHVNPLSHAVPVATALACGAAPRSPVLIAPIAIGLHVNGSAAASGPNPRRPTPSRCPSAPVSCRHPLLRVPADRPEPVCRGRSRRDLPLELWPPAAPKYTQ